MSKSICGVNCAECPSVKNCKGCAETKGSPYGKRCFIANYVLTGCAEKYQEFKQNLITEINALKIDGMEEVKELYPLVGNFVNLEYPLPNGEKVKMLNDDEIYLGAQVKNSFDESGKSCYGVVARESFILVCEYGEGGTYPEIVVFKRR